MFARDPTHDTEHLVEHHDVVDSTQVIAKERARAGADHGTMIVARAQTAGRGRKARSWLDVDDALLASIIVRPNAPVRFATRLPLAVCARLVGALDVLAPEAQVSSKWPNDLLVPAPAGAPDAPRFGPYRKVGGVLIEALEFGDGGATLACAVVGIGVNVRGDVPVDVRDTAGTLGAAGYPGSAHDLVTWVHAAVLDACTALDDASFTAIRALLEARSATIGRAVRIDEGDGVVEGIARAIDADGALVVERADGSRVTVRAGDADARP